ncbi:hypothetical protein ABK040_007401 [Willaertia magna]
MSSLETLSEKHVVDNNTNDNLVSPSSTSTLTTNNSTENLVTFPSEENIGLENYHLGNNDFTNSNNNKPSSLSLSSSIRHYRSSVSDSTNPSPFTTTNPSTTSTLQLSIPKSESNATFSPNTANQQQGNQQQQGYQWPWIEQIPFVVGEQLPVDEGNTVDYKLTVFSDYLNYKTSLKQEQQKIDLLLPISPLTSMSTNSQMNQFDHQSLINNNTNPNNGITSTIAAVASTTNDIQSPTTSNAGTTTTTTFDNVIDYQKLGERLTEYLIAFLNSNGGALIFGVRDDGIVMGMRLSEKQRDKIRLLLDNCIRNFQITPIPSIGVQFKMEFKKTENYNNLWILILEVKKSEYFHYAHIRNHLKSWERLNASNFCLCDRPQRFVERLRELRNSSIYQKEILYNRESSPTFINQLNNNNLHNSTSSSNLISSSRRNSIVNNNNGSGNNNINGNTNGSANGLNGNNTIKRTSDSYLTLVFSDCTMIISELILAKIGFDKRIFRLDQYSTMDDLGRFTVERPSKYFKLIYQFLQIGYVSVKNVDWPVFLFEADFYGLNELLKDEKIVKIEKMEGFVFLKLNK